MYIYILKNNNYEFLYIHHPILEMEHYQESIVIDKDSHHIDKKVNLPGRQYRYCLYPI